MASGFDVQEIQVCKEQLDKLTAYVLRSFHCTNGQGRELAKGLYGNSSFYSARGSYHALKTCNSWVADGLRTIGLSTPLWGGTAYAIMNHLGD